MTTTSCFRSSLALLSRTSPTKSMIYQVRGGLREEIQVALVLFEPLRYDEFYNMALKLVAAQLRCDASKKRVRDVTPSSSTQVAISTLSTIVTSQHVTQVAITSNM